MNFRFLFPLALIGAAGPAVAQEADSVADRMSMAVSTTVERNLTDLLEPRMILRVLLVAQQRVIADLCDGYELDPERFSAVMNNTLGELTGLVEEGQNNLVVDIVMVNLGIAMGGQRAVAAYDEAAYCANAQALRDELAGDTEGVISIWKPAP